MGRLIDADSLKKELYQQWFIDILLTQTRSEDMFYALAQKIDQQPTAYDTDKVVEQLEELKQYRAIGTSEECRAAMEKQTAIPREIIEGKYFCQKCHNLMPYPGYCRCGQKVY